ncbi:OapA N-terminal domain-containing protein [Kineothrix alysoides]
MGEYNRLPLWHRILLSSLLLIPLSNMLLREWHS